MNTIIAAIDSPIEIALAILVALACVVFIVRGLR